MQCGFIKDWNQIILPECERKVWSSVLLKITNSLKNVFSRNQVVGIRYGSSVFIGMVAMSVSICQNPKYLVGKYCNNRLYTFPSKLLEKYTCGTGKLPEKLTNRTPSMQRCSWTWNISQIRYTEITKAYFAIQIIQYFPWKPLRLPNGGVLWMFTHIWGLCSLEHEAAVRLSRKETTLGHTWGLCFDGKCKLWKNPKVSSFWGLWSQMELKTTV